MKNKKLDNLYNKLEELEKKKMMYLELDQNSNASRIRRKIRQVELEIELFNLDKMKRELAVYKKVVSAYPELVNQIKRELSGDY